MSEFHPDRLSFLLALLLVGFVSTTTYGQDFLGFKDDFPNGDPTNPDRDPVSWRITGGTATVEAGDLSLEGTGIVVAEVVGVEVENVSMEAQFRIVEGTNAGIGVRFESGDDCDFVAVNPESKIAQLLRCGSLEEIGDPIPLNFDFGDKDIKVRLDAVDDLLSVWVWPAESDRPVLPLATEPASADLVAGSVGIYVANSNGAPSKALIRYVNASAITDTPIGDLNDDGMLDVVDIDLLSNAVRIGLQESRFDLNHDGLVDNNDHTHWVQQLRRIWFGDANLDGEFNSLDLVEVFQANEYEDDLALSSTWATGDWNGDGDFNSSDFIVAFQDGGYERGPRIAVIQVPESTSPLALTCCFLSAILLTRPNRSVISRGIKPLGPSS